MADTNNTTVVLKPSEAHKVVGYAVLSTVEAVVTNEAAAKASAPVNAWLGPEAGLHGLSVSLKRRRIGADDLLILDGPLIKLVGGAVGLLSFRDNLHLYPGDELLPTLPPGVELRLGVIEVSE